MADKEGGVNKESSSTGSMESPIPSPIPTYSEEEKEVAQAIKKDFDAGKA